MSDQIKIIILSCLKTKLRFLSDQTLWNDALTEYVMQLSVSVRGGERECVCVATLNCNKPHEVEASRREAPDYYVVCPWRLYPAHCIQGRCFYYFFSKYLYSPCYLVDVWVAGLAAGLHFTMSDRIEIVFLPCLKTRQYYDFDPIGHSEMQCVL